MFFKTAEGSGRDHRRIGVPADHRGKSVETARVIAVSKDSVGITHVRFSVHYERVDTADELRNLALSSFSELFSERVLA